MESGGLGTDGRPRMPQAATDSQALLLRHPIDRQIEYHVAEAPHPYGEGFRFGQKVPMWDYTHSAPNERGIYRTVPGRTAHRVAAVAPVPQLRVVRVFSTEKRRVRVVGRFGPAARTTRPEHPSSPAPPGLLRTMPGGWRSMLPTTSSYSSGQLQQTVWGCQTRRAWQPGPSLLTPTLLHRPSAPMSPLLSAMCPP